MKKSVKRITKQDIMFVLALVFWAIASMSRFYDEKMISHATSFEVLQSEKVNLMAIACYFFLQCVFCLVCSMVCEKKRNVYYLIAFLSVFTFPMFCSANYFGVMDMYAWMITFIGGMLLVIQKAQWLLIPLSFLMTLICPMAVFSCECIIVALLIYKCFWKKSGKYVVLVILNIIAALAGVMTALSLGNAQTDAQDDVSLSRFIIMLICMSPYLLIAASFFMGIIKKSAITKKIGTLVVILGVLPSIVVNIYIQDYARVIFYVFTYFIMIVLVLMSVQDEEATEQLEITKDKIKEHLPIPALIIAYPLLFMSLWISGQYIPLKETFISK